MNPGQPRSLRKIIHIDMDAFYASVEQRDYPDYRGKPLVVGGSPEGRGGVVVAASYEARKFGIHSAMPSKKAVQLCPHVIFVSPRFAAYKEVSGKIREIFSRYTDLIEPLSLDEAYLDVTVDKAGIGSAIDIAWKIKHAIRDELGLTASAGISVNKFVAKIASDVNKPDGLTFVGPSRLEDFIARLPVEKFHGVGKVTAAKMKSLGLHNGEDLRNVPESDMVRHFGKVGRFFFHIVRGIDDRAVQPNRQTKSIGAEDTFAYDLDDMAELELAIRKISKIVAERIERHNMAGRSLTLKIKFSDFRLITRSQSFPNPINGLDSIISIAVSLLKDSDVSGKKIRLLGITLSNFLHPGHLAKNDPFAPLTLFPDE